jgi:hypothetical protein
MTLANNAILGRAVMHMIDAGYRVELSDQDGGGLYLYAWKADKPRPAKVDYWIRFTEGASNPEEMIRNYTANLQTVLKPVLDYAETLQALFADD